MHSINGPLHGELRERIPEYVEGELSFMPVGESFSIAVHPSGRRVSIAYVAHDPWPPIDFWGEDAERGVLRRYRARSTRERFLRRIEREGGVAFDVVEKSGALTAQPLGHTARPLGIYAVPRHISRSVQEEAMSVEEALDVANQTLSAYAAWQRGETCGLVVDRLTLDTRTGRLEVIESSPQWCAVDESTAARMAENRFTDDVRDALRAGPIR